MRYIGSAVLFAVLAAVCFAALPAHAQGSPQLVSSGAPIQGVLQSNDARNADGDIRDVYRFRARAGERVVIRLNSSAFDPVLRVTGPNGFREENDDSEGVNSMLDFTLAAGEYEISVMAYDPDVLGAYTLRLDSIGAVTAPQETASPAPSSPPARGGVLLDVTDTIAPDDLRDSDGRPSRYFSFSMQAGQQALIIAESAEFDTHLIVRGPGLSMENDNQHGFNYGAPRTYATSDTYNSAVYALAPANGTYQAWVARQQTDERGGRFRLRVIALERIALGAPLRGQLARGDILGMNGEFLDSYAFSGRAGQRVSVRVAEAPFNPTIWLQGPNEFRESDQGTELIATLPETGEYRVAVGGTWPRQGGNYVLTVR